MPGNFFQPHDKETGTSYNDWNDQRNTQQRKTVRKDVRWTNKVAKCGRSDRCA